MVFYFGGGVFSLLLDFQVFDGALSLSFDKKAVCLDVIIEKMARMV